MLARFYNLPLKWSSFQWNAVTKIRDSVLFSNQNIVIVLAKLGFFENVSSPTNDKVYF